MIKAQLVLFIIMLDMPALAASDAPKIDISLHNEIALGEVLSTLAINLFVSAGRPEYRSLEHHATALTQSTYLRVATDMCTLFARAHEPLTQEVLRHQLTESVSCSNITNICAMYALILRNPEALPNVCTHTQDADFGIMHPGVLAVAWELAKQAATYQEESTGDHDQRSDDLPERLAEFQSAIEHNNITLPKITLF